MYRFEVSHYKVHIRRPGAGKGRVRAAFLTDLHDSDWGEGFALLKDALDVEEPDIVLVGGDMITAVPGTSTERIAGLMADIASRYPVYYGCGNHEYRLCIYPETYGDMYKEYISALRRSGVIFLPNRKASAEVNGVRLDIYGYNIKRRYYKRFRNQTMPVSELENVFGSPEDGAVSILLAHTPRYMETYLDWGADLTLCGHNHGGIIRLNSEVGLIDPDLSLLSKRSKGRYSKDGRTCIVSAGLGEHTVKMRFNNPREIVIADIAAGS